MVIVLIVLLILLLVALLLVGYLFARTFATESTTPSSPRSTRGSPTLHDLNLQRGADGEAETAGLLRQLPATEYDIFNTVVLAPDHAADRGVEMDHVVLSRFGIFVVETKRWGGHVQGGLDGDWVQSIGRQVHPKRNPYAQNDRQVRRLRNHLGVGPSAIRGVVCFVGDTTLGLEVPANVVRSSGLNTYITGFRTTVLDDVGLARYRTMLRELAGPPD